MVSVHRTGNPPHCLIRASLRFPELAHVAAFIPLQSALGYPLDVTIHWVTRNPWYHSHTWPEQER
jgi:hypothetical protein